MGHVRQDRHLAPVFFHLVRRLCLPDGRRAGDVGTHRRFWSPRSGGTSRGSPRCSGQAARFVRAMRWCAASRGMHRSSLSRQSRCAPLRGSPANAPRSRQRDAVAVSERPSRRISTARGFLQCISVARIGPSPIARRACSFAGFRGFSPSAISCKVAIRRLRSKSCDASIRSCRGKPQSVARGLPLVRHGLDASAMLLIKSRRLHARLGRTPVGLASWSWSAMAIIEKNAARAMSFFDAFGCSPSDRLAALSESQTSMTFDFVAGEALERQAPPSAVDRVLLRDRLRQPSMCRCWSAPLDRSASGRGRTMTKLQTALARRPGGHFADGSARFSDRNPDRRQRRHASPSGPARHGREHAARACLGCCLSGSLVPRGDGQCLALAGARGAWDSRPGATIAIQSSSSSRHWPSTPPSASVRPKTPLPSPFRSAPAGSRRPN